MVKCIVCEKELIKKQIKYCSENCRKKYKNDCNNIIYKKRKEEWESLTPQQQHEEMMLYVKDYLKENN